MTITEIAPTQRGERCDAKASAILGILCNGHECGKPPHQAGMHKCRFCDILFSTDMPRALRW